MLVRPEWTKGQVPETAKAAPLRPPRAETLDGERPYGDADLPHVDLSRFWRVIIQRRAIILATMVASLFVAILYLALATPRYSASSLLLIDTKNSSVLRTAPLISDAAVDSANIESQVEILKSERILQKVVLDQDLRDAAVLAPSAFATALAWTTQHIAFWHKPPTPIAGQDAKLIAAARALQKLVGIKRVGTTYLVEISAEMSSPAEAANVANSIARNYVSDQQSFREELARRQSSLLQARSNELQDSVSRAEAAVEQLKFSGSMKGETSAAARVELKNLESTAQTFRVLHDKFLEQSAESWQQQFVSLPDATVASPAYPPLSKSSPKSLIVLACSLLLGLSGGVIIVLLLDRRTLGLTRRSVDA